MAANSIHFFEELMKMAHKNKQNALDMEATGFRPE